MSLRRSGATFALALFGACAPPDYGRPPQPVGWDDQVQVGAATNTAPNVVELALDARVSTQTFVPGTTTPAWTYNGSIPGPLIRAHVGDRIIVHFTNHLPEETTVHWHGIRLQAAMDGVPGFSQPAVPPGGSFDYSFVAPDPGLFWYHPHIESAKQAGYGLYGAILVEDTPETDQVEAPKLGDDLVLVLSDVDVNADGSLGDPTTGGDFGTLFGREGNTLLVNGKVKPTILARPGLRQRWRIVNAAKSRYFQLALDGNTFTTIGVDGGFIQAPIQNQQQIVVLPGGRADVIVEPRGAPGMTETVHWVPYDRGYGSTYNIPAQDLFYVKLTDDVPYVEPTPLPAELRTIAPLDLSTALSRTLSLDQVGTSSPLVLGINGEPTYVGVPSLALGINGVPMSMAAPMSAKVGTTEVWTITNTMAFDHPFHVHGFFFQPLDSITGAALPSPQWLDTYNVPQMQSVQIAIKYDDRPGMWMFHCHILDHADAGMSAMLMLSE